MEGDKPFISCAAACCAPKSPPDSTGLLWSWRQGTVWINNNVNKEAAQQGCGGGTILDRKGSEMLAVSGLVCCRTQKRTTPACQHLIKPQKYSGAKSVRPGNRFLPVSKQAPVSALPS